jgi:nucleoside-diphosphate-sugar epimerase
MKILVTGGAGYLGSVLIPKLLIRGHQVRVLDIGYFGLGHMQGLRPSVEVVREDIRLVNSRPDYCDEVLDGCDCVIHLAAISNDPSAELQPELTREVNYLATVALAKAAKRRGVKFLFSSSCSVYGEAQGLLDETGPKNPLTVYAISKVQSEEALEELADENWRPVILRNGTLFGYSTRMRFDLVINIFSLYGTLYNEIKIFGEGLQWRPFLHVSDCAKAFIFFAEKERSKYLHYNVSHRNYRVIDVARVFEELKPGLKVAYVPTADADNRDYSVSTARLAEEGFQTAIDIAPGAEEIMDSIVNGTIRDPESVFYRNAKWLKELTHLGTADHRQMMTLMEQMHSLRRFASA